MNLLEKCMVLFITYKKGKMKDKEIKPKAGFEIFNCSYFNCNCNINAICSHQTGYSLFCTVCDYLKCLHILQCFCQLYRQGLSPKCCSFLITIVCCFFSSISYVETQNSILKLLYFFTLDAPFLRLSLFASVHPLVVKENCNVHLQIFFF